jgi:hypothetical protein
VKPSQVRSKVATVHSASEALNPTSFASWRHIWQALLRCESLISRSPLS